MPVHYCLTNMLTCQASNSSNNGQSLKDWATQGLMQQQDTLPEADDPGPT